MEIEVLEVSFWDATTDETVLRWITAVGLLAMRRQCTPTGRRKKVDRSEVANEVWQGEDESD